MNKLITKAKNIFKSKKGASMIEIIVWVSVVLVIATVLFLFRDAISTFIQNAINRVSNFQVN